MTEARHLPAPGGGWFTFAQGSAAVAEAPARPRQSGFLAAPPAEATARRIRPTGLDALHLSLGAILLVVPASLVERLVAMPALRPMPGAHPGVAGLAEFEGAPILVLRAGFAAGGVDASGAEATLLCVMREGGRRFGLPASRIVAGAATADFATWLASPEAAEALAMAPHAAEAQPVLPTPQRHLVLFRAAGMELALPVEAVTAVLSPTLPVPTPRHDIAGVVAHRGAVLPVLDGGLILGGRPSLADGPAPLLRLALQPEVVVAVEQVSGVRVVPASEVTPLARRDGMVAAFARWAGAPLPVLAAHRLGAL